MLHKRIGWRVEHPNKYDAPPAGTLEAVALLFRHDRTGEIFEHKGEGTQTAEPQRTLVWIRESVGMLWAEVVSSRPLSWRTRSSSGVSASDVEDTAMIKEEDDNDAGIEARLQALMAKPDLAEEAFPDKQIREKIVPLFRHFRGLGREATKSSGE